VVARSEREGNISFLYLGSPEGDAANRRLVLARCEIDDRLVTDVAAPLRRGRAVFLRPRPALRAGNGVFLWTTRAGFTG
jgi:hypothetical protein